MEMEGEEFHAKVADAYLKIAEEHPERFVVVDADGRPARCSTRCASALDRDRATRDGRRLTVGTRERVPAAASTAEPVLDSVPGQEPRWRSCGAAARPHHAYVLAGPEGVGKSLAARAFAAALLCHDGGCGECRACRLALEDQHPNEFVVEPEGRDIHVDTIREEVWQPAYRTAPEPGRKVFLIREADRLSPAAADTLLKVLEEPPADAVFLLLSARAHELPETVLSRCHVVTFTALSEPFVVDDARRRGRPERARRALAARLAGGNLGRARRLAVDAGRPARSATRARDALEPRRGARRARSRPPTVVLEAAAEYKQGPEGRAAERSSRRSWTRRAGPRRPTGARSAGSRRGSSGRSAGPSATTSTGCSWRSRRCSATAIASASAAGDDLLHEPRPAARRSARGRAGRRAGSPASRRRAPSSPRTST